MSNQPLDQAEIVKRRAAIDQLNFTVQHEFLMQPKPQGQGWTHEQALNAEVWYRRFLTLLLMFPDQNLVPHPAVDKVWHAHIAEDTEQYMQDCEAVFGHYLHHESEDHEMSKEMLDLWYERTQERLRQVFGEDYSKLAWAEKPAQ